MRTGAGTSRVDGISVPSSGLFIRGYTLCTLQQSCKMLIIISLYHYGQEIMSTETSITGPKVTEIASNGAPGPVP